MPRQYIALRVCVLPWEMELENPATANDLVAVVEDGGLTGSDGALGLVKGCDRNFAGTNPAGSAGPGGLMPVADLDLHAHGSGQGWNADPIESPGTQSGRGQFRIGADRDAMACVINLQDVKRRR